VQAGAFCRCEFQITLKLVSSGAQDSDEKPSCVPPQANVVDRSPGKESYNIASALCKLFSIISFIRIASVCSLVAITGGTE